MATSKSFQGTSVFMSRKLVPPEIFDTLHDALKQNGADVILCSDPSRTGPDDYHVISSSEHEKFEDLRSKGCNLLGPQCVLSCAKEHRPLPKQGFTCCLAMDGVRVLASGFEKEEKDTIAKLVTAMGGMLQTKVSTDVNFVIVKNVLAAKYKWAANTLKKPIVTINWLYQCWNEHRLVTQESYRVLPLAGLTICVTRILADERREMEKLIIQNGGKYSAELTKKCTHLVCDAPEGDKYKVARRWGHIHIVTRRWIDQSIARRACLNEESYPVQGGFTSSINKLKASSTTQHCRDRVIRTSQSAASSVAVDSNQQADSCSGVADPDLVSNLSQNNSSALEAPDFARDEGRVSPMQNKNETSCDGCVADDSQIDDTDLYLSDCRILLVGFEATEMRKLVNLVRRGGGSRYMLFSEKLTHLVAGTPSEMEMKELRSLASLGIIKVVRTTWLEDCDREKKEIPVLQRHIAHDLLLKDPVCLGKGISTGSASIKQGRDSTMPYSIHGDLFTGSMSSGSGMTEKKREASMDVDMNVGNSLDARTKSTVNEKFKGNQKMQLDSSIRSVDDRKASSVFEGRLFRFSNSFAVDRRAEIVQWLNQGGGEVVNEQHMQKVHFCIENHGLTPKSSDDSECTCVSSHWIKSCLEDGCLLDVSSHILYSPLPCQVPLPCFENFRFCVSQYEDKERILLRNLCFVLGAKFVEKLTRKVTHLLCKFKNGPKYDAACKWGIHTTTSDWIYSCVRQNEVVSLAPFCPKDATAQDRKAGLCTSSQYPSQAVRMLYGENPSQALSQSQGHRSLPNQSITSKIDIVREEEAKDSSPHSKRARVLEDCREKSPIRPLEQINTTIYEMHVAEDDVLEKERNDSHALPDVAAAIEDLLEQTSKIHDLKLPEKTDSGKSLLSADCSILGQDHTQENSTFGFSKQWSQRTEKIEDPHNTGDKNASIYDGFSETQTESQVVGYEEDLSGRQMIIDKARIWSSMT